MENRGYSIYEVGILGGNDKGEIKFILFLMFDQKYFLEIALENDYKRKEEIAKANERVLKLGNRKV